MRAVSLLCVGAGAVASQAAVLNLKRSSLPRCRADRAKEGTMMSKAPSVVLLAMPEPAYVVPSPGRPPAVEVPPPATGMRRIRVVAPAAGRRPLLMTGDQAV
jgi:hypothetical protein